MISHKHKSVPLLLALLVFLTPVIIFSKLAGEVIEKDPILLDTTILKSIHEHASPFLNHLFLFITTLGSFKVIAPVTIALVLWFYYKNQRRSSLIIAFSVLGAATANFILKLLFTRSRPALWETLVKEPSYSFPSGHAMVSCALILSIIFIVWQTKYRFAALVAGSLLIVLIGLSRLYLGVHYPTDVIAGWSASIVWVIIVVTIAKRFSDRLHITDEDIQTDNVKQSQTKS